MTDTKDNANPNTLPNHLVIWYKAIMGGINNATTQCKNNKEILELLEHLRRAIVEQRAKVSEEIYKKKKDRSAQAKISAAAALDLRREWVGRNIQIGMVVAFTGTRDGKGWRRILDIYKQSSNPTRYTILSRVLEPIGNIRWTPGLGVTNSLIGFTEGRFIVENDSGKLRDVWYGENWVRVATLMKKGIDILHE